MIFLDANIFLRHFEAPSSPDSTSSKETARHLMASIANDDVQATTSEVVLHEVCFILRSKHHYARQPEEIIGRMRVILGFPALVFPNDDKVVYLRALELWEQHPKLEFSDSVIAARCERAGHELATFDGHFDAIPSLKRWNPDAKPSTGS